MHFVKAGGVTIPPSFINKATLANKGSYGFAAAAADGSCVVTRSGKGGMSEKDVTDFLTHTDIKDHPCIFHLGDENVSMPEDDLQPFVLLRNAEDEPVLVAFLDGDFSSYHDAGSSHTDEYLCVQKELVPRIAKINKFMQNNLHALMKEIQDDEQYARDWINFIDGPRGSITLLAATGDRLTLNVAGDNTHHSFDNWWASNAYGEVSTKSSVVDKAKSTLADLGARLGKAGGKPGGLKLPGSKPVAQIASTEPIPQASPVKTAPPDAKPVSDPGTGKPGVNQPQGVPQLPTPSPDGKPDLGDPDTLLTIKIPSGLDTKRKAGWMRKRMPEGMLPQTIAGITEIKLKRRDATPAFLQSYIEQNGLKGQDALVLMKKDTLKSTTASVPTVKSEAKPEDKPKETGFPAKPGDKEVQVPAPGPAPASVVTTEMLPILSPEQRAKMVAFSTDAETIQAVDRAGKLIADPKNMQKVEKQIASFRDQLGGKVDIDFVSKWPLELHMKHNIEDPRLGAQIRFWMGHEILKLLAMLDQLTGTQVADLNKKEADVKPAAPAQKATQQAAKPTRGPLKIPGLRAAG